MDIVRDLNGAPEQLVGEMTPPAGREQAGHTQFGHGGRK